MTANEHVPINGEQDNFSGLSELNARLQEKLEDIKQIIEVNAAVIKLAITDLDSIRHSLNESGKGGGISKRIENQIQQMNALPKSPEITDGQAKMRSQVLVLFVGSLETYLDDLIKYIGNKRPSLFNFSDAKEKISFDQQLLKDGFTLGDAVLEHMHSKGANFQDLQSILRTLVNYLGIDIELSQENKDTIILCTGIRHLIIHNSSVINREFQNHIRSIEYKENYKLNNVISVDIDLIESLENAILNLADQIMAALIPKIEP